MIKLIAHVQDDIEIICDTKDELEFCNTSLVAKWNAQKEHHIASLNDLQDMYNNLYKESRIE